MTEAGRGQARRIRRSTTADLRRTDFEYYFCPVATPITAERAPPVWIASQLPNELKIAQESTVEARSQREDPRLDIGSQSRAPEMRLILIRVPTTALRLTALTRWFSATYPFSLKHVGAASAGPNARCLPDPAHTCEMSLRRPLRHADNPRIVLSAELFS